MGSLCQTLYNDRKPSKTLWFHIPADKKTLSSMYFNSFKSVTKRVGLDPKHRNIVTQDLGSPADPDAAWINAKHYLLISLLDCLPMCLIA